jgi:rhodanese-related sulfurtransferase
MCDFLLIYSFSELMIPLLTCYNRNNFNEKHQNEDEMDIISIDDLHGKIDGMGDNDLILDVRSPEEFSSGHIKGARNEGHESVAGIADELKSYGTVYVHCKMGGRAKMASEALEGAGLTNIVCVGNGGMERWGQMGWPTER